MKCLMCQWDVEADLNPAGLMSVCADEDACMDRAVARTEAVLAEMAAKELAAKATTNSVAPAAGNDTPAGVTVPNISRGTAA